MNTFHFYRFCNFGNVLSLQRLDDSDITQMQQMVKNQYMKWVENNVNGEKTALIDYFGPIHAGSPKMFMFSCGDIKMITQLSEYVKGTVQRKGYKYFKETSGQPSGAVNRQSNDSTFSLEDVQEKLFAGIFDSIKPYGDDVTSLLNREMIMVTNENGVMSGKVQCVLCDSGNISEQKRKRKRQQYLQFWNGKNWVVSNFAKHLSNVHPIELYKLIKKNSNSERYESNQSLIELKIEPINIKSDNEFEFQLNRLQSQLTFHSIQMVNISHRNMDLKAECEIELSSGQISRIQICRIPTDGNCLFAAAVHQHLHMEIGSEDNKHQTIELRKKVVAHIEENLELYERDLMDRIYDKCDSKKKIQNTHEECKDFLRNYLSKERHWGGSETLKAIGELFSVNIIVFSERGEVYFGNLFNSMYTNILALAFRISSQCNKNESKTQYDHYDSVIKLDEDIIQKCASILIENHKKSLSLKETTETIDIE